ncbi:hypothetical protein M1E17_10945 [Arthrobacter sp. D1-29]
MNRAVAVYAVILQMAGFVTLGVYGVSQAQRQDPRGVIVLVLLVCGLVLILTLALRQYRNIRNGRRMLAGKSFRAYTFHTSADAEYGHAPATVWELIRPAEAAILLDGAAKAFTVPGTPGGEGELQCFISAEGQVSAIEILSEDAGRSAVTRAVNSSEYASVETRYTLEPITAGCRLTMEVLYESPVPMPSAQKHAIRAHSRGFLEKVRHLLDTQSAQKIEQGL